MADDIKKAADDELYLIRAKAKSDMQAMFSMMCRQGGVWTPLQKKMYDEAVKRFEDCDREMIDRKLSVVA